MSTRTWPRLATVARGVRETPGTLFGIRGPEVARLFRSRIVNVWKVLLRRWPLAPGTEKAEGEPAKGFVFFER